MTLPGPEDVTKYTAGSEVELRLHGFFHEGVNRIAICFRDDHDCNAPSDFTDYILGFHFTEGTSGTGGHLYTVDMPFKVKLPNRNGRECFNGLWTLKMFAHMSPAAMWSSLVPKALA